ncbi:MAG TPA: DinB family protein [Terriglobia bacterium]|nr:DinB family protein [Terriglobia bacterium]
MATNFGPIQAPEASEYAPYYGQYISMVSGNDVLRALEEQRPATAALFERLSDQQADYRYAPEKWSVKEVLGHIIDTERIMSYRALRIARHDKKPLAGFEQDDYVRAAQFGQRKLAGLVEEFTAVRHATLLLFQNLGPEAWMRLGIANEKEVSVRALAYIIAGHELHHRKILQEKYLMRAARA